MAAKVFVHYLFGTLFVLVYFGGMVLAKGFWSTLVSVTFFPWGIYLVVEKAMLMLGIV